MDTDVAAAEEEAVGDVGWAAAGGETVKAVGCVVGVGGENGEEGVEVCLVGAVWGVGTGCAKVCVWAFYGYENWFRLVSFDYWDEAEQANKQSLVSGDFGEQIIHSGEPERALGGFNFDKNGD
ncbi:hypothetical protein RHGRI_037325 [Rhododendron griersonianum]|uniref:Uncharacterized protein n=1 Tax=Rhododendron griersonianum TaxID=479676 RepID=A0AAV6HRZ2_9ERIC|nr:hypothetical protein RHGRI_037325 [Rhododendron griersonianum]